MALACSMLSHVPTGLAPHYFTSGTINTLSNRELATRRAFEGCHRALAGAALLYNRLDLCGRPNPGSAHADNPRAPDPAALRDTQKPSSARYAAGRASGPNDVHLRGDSEYWLALCSKRVVPGSERSVDAIE